MFRDILSNFFRLEIIIINNKRVSELSDTKNCVFCCIACSNFFNFISNFILHRNLTKTNKFEYIISRINCGTMENFNCCNIIQFYYQSYKEIFDEICWSHLRQAIIKRMMRFACAYNPHQSLENLIHVDSQPNRNAITFIKLDW